MEQPSRQVFGYLQKLSTHAERRRCRPAIGEAMTPITFYSYHLTRCDITQHLQPHQPNMVEMGDYYLANDLSILDFNAGTRTTIIANAHPYNHQTNSKLLWSVEADGTRYYMLQNGSMYEFDEVARDLVYITYSIIRSARNAVRLIQILVLIVYRC